MKAFPLEYVGCNHNGVTTDDGLLRRQAAMIRYYRHLFGVEPFPRWAGEKGWLWRPSLAPLLDIA
jgi:hypothetical protein